MSNNRIAAASSSDPPPYTGRGPNISLYAFSFFFHPANPLTRSISWFPRLVRSRETLITNPFTESWKKSAYAAICSAKSASTLLDDLKSAMVGMRFPTSSRMNPAMSSVPEYLSRSLTNRCSIMVGINPSSSASSTNLSAMARPFWMMSSTE